MVLVASYVPCFLLPLVGCFELILNFHFQLVYAPLSTCQFLLQVGDVLVAQFQMGCEGIA